jgi:hypothetical protein
MRGWLSVSVWSLLGLVALVWTLYTLRLGAVLAALLFIGALAIPALRQRRWLLAVLIAVVVLYPLQPVDITFRSTVGLPKLVRCCPGAPYRNLEATRAMDRAGACLFCSDIGSGFDASWFLVW